MSVIDREEQLERTLLEADIIIRHTVESRERSPARVVLEDYDATTELYRYTCPHCGAVRSITKAAFGTSGVNELVVSCGSCLGFITVVTER